MADRPERTAQAKVVGPDRRESCFLTPGAFVRKVKRLVSLDGSAECTRLNPLIETVLKGFTA
jgi:hypothetical protein